MKNNSSLCRATDDEWERGLFAIVYYSKKG